MVSRRYRLVLLAVKIIDLIMNPEYDVDDSLHCKKCCRACNQGVNASKYKQGVSYDKQRGKFKFQMGTGENRVSKRFDSLEEATYAYKESREEYVRRVVRRWEGLIDESIFNKLISWEFEI